MMASVFGADDIFWGQLGGAMEAVDSGTTTVVDFAHMLYSAEHGMKFRQLSLPDGETLLFEAVIFANLVHHLQSYKCNFCIDGFWHPSILLLYSYAYSEDFGAHS
jgi:hypothetical protein